MHMKIKPAQVADTAVLADVWYKGWYQAHAQIVPPALVNLRTPAEFAGRIAAHLGQTHVAWQDDQIVGFFMLDQDEIYQFYVNRPYQGTGVATRLMQAAEDALGDGLKWLACSVGNERAAAFYEKCGWTQAGAIPYEVETGEGPLVVDVWRYEKRLRIA
tara:strand:+ start:6293 stop:6769 length:477 start_codon:yes stop_codon:yes gene_type:complete